jgi:hypothetical protein
LPAFSQKRRKKIKLILVLDDEEKRQVLSALTCLHSKEFFQVA